MATQLVTMLNRLSACDVAAIIIVAIVSGAFVVGLIMFLMIAIVIGSTTCSLNEWPAT
jgi:hypothetical protein